MPREFQDFSQEVSQGTDKIKGSLDAVRNAADKADESSSRLSNTQDAGTRVADSYSKTMAGLSKELARTASSGQDVARGLGMADSAIRNLGNTLNGVRAASGDATKGLGELRDVASQVIYSMGQISGRKVGVKFDADSAIEAREAIEKLSKGLNQVDGEVKRLRQIDTIGIDFSNAEKDLKSMRASVQLLNTDFEQLLKRSKTRVEKLQKEIGNLEKKKRALTKGEKITLVEKNVELVRLREFMEYLDGADISRVNKQLILTADSTGGLSEAVKVAASNIEDLASNMDSASDAATEAAMANKKYTGEVEKAQSVMDLLNNRFQKGKKEAAEYAGGLGVTNGRLIGAGVAMVFIAGKAAELIDKFKDARMELARFNIDIAVLQSTSQPLGLTASLEDVRSQLNLTRKETIEFFKVLSKGALSGVAETDRLVRAAKQLQDTFGGDPTKRLDEYVDLLKQIPTLEADLSVTASLDDKAASIFALAQAGKIETVLELQSAGLLGGAPEELSPQDVELLNAQQKTEKTVEDIHDVLLNKLFPSIGPQLSAIIAGTSKVAMAIGGVATAVGVVSALGAAQVSAQHLTTAAILKKDATDNAGELLKQFKKDSKMGGKLDKIKDLLKNKLGSKVAIKETAKSFGRAVQGGFKGAIKGAVRGGGNMLRVGGMAGNAMGAGGVAAAGTATLLATTALVAGLGLAGIKLSSFGDELETQGKVVGAGFAKLGAATAKIAAGMLVAGPIGGVLVAATLAATDLGKGLTLLGEHLTGTVDGVAKFNVAGQALGYTMRGLAMPFNAIGMTIKNLGPGLKQFGSDLVEGTKVVAEWTGSIIGAMTYSTDYKEKLADVAGETAEYNKTLGDLRRTSKAYDAEIARRQSEMGKSALTLQKTLAGLESDVKSLKIGFLELQKSIGETEIETLQMGGGSAAAFDRALSSTVTAVKKRFTELNKATASRRMQVLEDLKNDKISASDARNALMRIRDEEIKATKEFITGIRKLTSELYKTPGIMIDQLKAQATQKFRDFTLDLTQTGTAESTLQGTAFQIERAEAVFEQLENAAIKSGNEMAKAQEMLKEKSKEAAQSIRDNMGSLPAEAQSTLNKVFSGKEIDADAAEKSLKEVSEIASSSASKINELTNSLDSASFTRAAGDIADTAERLRGAQTTTKKAREELEKLEKKGASGTKIKEAKESLLEAQKNQAQIASEMMSNQESIAKKYKKAVGEYADTEEGQELLNKIIGEVASGSAVTAHQMVASGKFAGKQLDALNKIKEKEEEILYGTGQSAGLFTEIDEEAKKLKGAVAIQGSLEAALVGVDGSILAWENMNEQLDKLGEGSELMKKAIDQISEAAQKGLTSMRQQVEIEKTRLEMSKLFNNTSEAYSAVKDAELALADKQLKQNEMARKKVKEAIAERKKNIKEAQTWENNVDPTIARKAKSTIAREEIGLIALEKELMELNQAAVEAAVGLGNAADNIQGMFDVFEQSDFAKLLTQQMDLSDALAEVAEFSDEMGKTLAASTSIAIATAKMRAAEENAINEKAFAEEMERIKKRAAALGQTVGPEAAQEYKQEQERLALSKKRTMEAQIELKQKQKVAAAAEREASLKLDAIGTEEELINAEMEFLSEIGGSFSSIIKLQQAGVGLEQQKLNALQEQLETQRAAGVSGLKLRKLEVAVEKQKFALQRKAFGVQKDVWEKLIGKEFGELRTDVGARRRRGTDVGLLGRERTRVMGRGGLFMNTGPGGPGTIAQRSADRILKTQLTGLGGMPGMGLAGEAPERLSIEEEIANAGKGTEEHTKTLADEGTRKGSLYTHDVSSEGYLKTIALNTSMMAQNTEATKGSQEESKNQLRKMYEQAQKQLLASKDGVVLASSPKDAKADARTAEQTRTLQGVEKKQDTQTKSISEQLSIAKKSFREQIVIAQNLGKKGTDQEEAAKAFEAASQEVSNIQSIEKAIRRQQAMNPLAVGSSSAEMRRIASGKASPEEKALIKMQSDISQKAATANKSAATEMKNAPTETAKTTATAMSDVWAKHRKRQNFEWKKPEPVDWKAKKAELVKQKMTQIMTETERAKAVEDASKFDYSVINGMATKERTTPYGMIQSYGGDAETKEFKRIVENAQYTPELIGGKYDDMAKAIFDTGDKSIKADKQLAKDVTKTTPAEVAEGKRGETNQSVVAPVSDRQNREESMRNARSTTEDVAGMSLGAKSEFGGTSVVGPKGAGAMASSSAIQVTGQISISLNTKMFNAEVKNLVAQAMSDPQVRSQLNKEYLNTKTNA